MASEGASPVIDGERRINSSYEGDGRGPIEGEEIISVGFALPSIFGVTSLAGSHAELAPPDNPPSSEQQYLGDGHQERGSSTQIERIDFLEDGDIETAQAVVNIINAPENRAAFVSPYRSVNEDPNCDDIFEEVRKPDKKIAVARDQNGRVVGTAQLSYHPNRAHLVTWYLGSLSPDVQGKGLGKQFIVKLAEKTFDTPVIKDGHETDVQLILMEVILNEGNKQSDYSEATRKQFPPMYRLLNDLDRLVQEGTVLRPHILNIDGTGYLSVAEFSIWRHDFAAYTESMSDEDIV